MEVERKWHADDAEGRDEHGRGERRFKHDPHQGLRRAGGVGTTYSDPTIMPAWDVANEKKTSEVFIGVPMRGRWH